MGNHHITGIFRPSIGRLYHTQALPAPVSYTHLDVYKRQIPGSQSFPLPQKPLRPHKTIRLP